ncbi:unnamed protein product [Didymodactylos carnosus]|uniref:glutathione transferase n=1 Tax=Didymodactylos carnosus TaxID=1234261 RepID=A0A815QSD5_9BILA|nr:unnamed protein product [Didymodactylos carnosus]CAF1467106.1 unnamed protein product [Didymodactylos carnosus]CAF3548282.1 unnamed protein product [Didymodactylos carnosus]CAF4335951.1 unnamed protein product [Didymodactylos carnosus]
MPNYKLYYFDGRGRGEFSRLIFAAADQQFEDVRYPQTEWPSHKQEMPLGQMPVLEVDGIKIPQSFTIARFLAKQFNLAGKDNLEQAKADATVDTIADLMAKLSPLMYDKDEVRKQQGIKKFQEEELPKHLQNLEKLAKLYGNGAFFVGGSLTWADLVFYEISNSLLKLDPNVLKDYQQLLKTRQEVEKHPKVSAYLKSRPESQF